MALKYSVLVEMSVEFIAKYIMDFKPIQLEVDWRNLEITSVN
jgi:hypothetical protein